ncbi:MAG: PA14 domain-containing protein [Armatimonadota bacterium]
MNAFAKTRSALVLCGLTCAVLLALSAVACAQTGITAEYYKAGGSQPDRIATFQPANLLLTRQEFRIDVDWGNYSPDPAVPADGFAARWTGKITAPASEDFTFYTECDDGSRLWVSETPIDPANPGTPVINNWVDQGPTEKASKAIKLEAGKTYFVMMEYYENGGGAVARLKWKSASVAKQAIWFRPFAYINGTLKGPDGSPLKSVTVKASGPPEGPFTATTKTDGTFSIRVLVADYVLNVSHELYYIDPPVQVKGITEGATISQDLTATVLPDISLATKDLPEGVAWKVLPTGSAEDNAPADPAFDDSGWQTIDVPKNLNPTPVGTNTYFWYRLKFKLPAEWKQFSDRYLVLWNYNLDDYDWAYFNGHFIGSVRQWDARRRYVIPAAWVNWDGDNVLALKGWQGGGGAGINPNAPRLHVGNPQLGVILGKATISGTTSAAVGTTLTLTSPADPAFKRTTTPSSFDGGFTFADLDPGDYTVSIGGRTVMSATPTVAAASVAGGKTANVAFEVTTIPFFESTAPDPVLSTDFTKPLDPAVWKDEDINTKGGSTVVKDGALTINADGADIWDTADQFRYVYTKISGDFAATIRVMSVPTTDGWAKAGLMIRAGNGKGDAHSFAAATRDNGTRLQWRPAANGSSSDDAATAQGYTPGEYIKIVRRGTRVEMYMSFDGTIPIFVTEQPNPGLSADEVLLGVAVTSHSAGNVGTATFQDLRVWRLPRPAPMKGDLDGDGKVTVADATLAIRMVVGLVKPTPEQLRAGDVLGMGAMTVNNAVVILRAAVGLIKL